MKISTIIIIAVTAIFIVSIIVINSKNLDCAGGKIDSRYCKNPTGWGGCQYGGEIDGCCPGWVMHHYTKNYKVCVPEEYQCIGGVPETRTCNLSMEINGEKRCIIPKDSGLQCCHGFTKVVEDDYEYCVQM